MAGMLLWANLSCLFDELWIHLADWASEHPLVGGIFIRLIVGRSTHCR